MNLWCQWSDLDVPQGITLFSPANMDLDQDDLSKIDFYVPTYMAGRRALEHIPKMTNLKVLQLPTAGYEEALEFKRPGVILCNAAGVHTLSTAELTLGLIIASLRGLPQFVRDQEKGNWNHRTFQSLADKKIAIIGFGSIGKKIAEILQPFEVSIKAFTRSGSTGTIPLSELDQQISEFDVIIIITPLNEESANLFDAARLSALKDGALLVNVARGPIVNTNALVSELRKGRIFAALDVTDPEPLPENHPLWGMPNCLISPHVGGDSSAFEPRFRRLLKRQLERCIAGEEMINIVAN